MSYLFSGCTCVSARCLAPLPPNSRNILNNSQCKFCCCGSCGEVFGCHKYPPKQQQQQHCSVSQCHIGNFAGKSNAKWGSSCVVVYCILNGWMCYANVNLYGFAESEICLCVYAKVHNPRRASFWLWFVLVVAFKVYYVKTHARQKTMRSFFNTLRLTSI